MKHLNSIYWRGLVTALWWAIDMAWRDDEGRLTSESLKWSHVLLPSGAIFSQKYE